MLTVHLTVPVTNIIAMATTKKVVVVVVAVVFVSCPLVKKHTDLFG